jgi:glutamate N-acetyltransferase / amino-acid N-acetyltransferase
MINYIQSGTITSVPGFSAGAIYSGIKTETQLDLGILYCNTPCIAAAVFTTNQIKAAPVIISKNHLSSRTAQAIVVNSGCANACLAEQGLSDALEMAVLTAKKLKINVEDVLVASTGLIGAPLPMDQIRKGINTINIDYQGGHKLAIAMMTTDSKPKEVAIEVLDEKGKYVIGGVTKGAGMIHPQMATMLCFIGTNALVKPDFLQHSLNKAVEISFNLIDVDGDTSTNDCVFLLASGSANNKILDNNNGDVFQKALNEACIYLAKSMVRDAEGATKFIEVTVKGALTESSAKQIARNIASSTLVKTAIFGNDPNWGRIMAVLGMVKTKSIFI